MAFPYELTRDEDDDFDRSVQVLFDEMENLFEQGDLLHQHASRLVAKLKAEKEMLQKQNENRWIYGYYANSDSQIYTVKQGIDRCSEPFNRHSIPGANSQVLQDLINSKDPLSISLGTKRDSKYMHLLPNSSDLLTSTSFTNDQWLRNSSTMDDEAKLLSQYELEISSNLHPEDVSNMQISRGQIKEQNDPSSTNVYQNGEQKESERTLRAAENSSHPPKPAANNASLAANKSQLKKPADQSKSVTTASSSKKHVNSSKESANQELKTQFRTNNAKTEDGISTGKSGKTPTFRAEPQVSKPEILKRMGAAPVKSTGRNATKSYEARKESGTYFLESYDNNADFSVRNGRGNTTFMLQGNHRSDVLHEGVGSEDSVETAARGTGAITVPDFDQRRDLQNETDSSEDSVEEALRVAHQKSSTAAEPNDTTKSARLIPNSNSAGSKGQPTITTKEHTSGVKHKTTTTSALTREPQTTPTVAETEQKINTPSTINATETANGSRTSVPVMPSGGRMYQEDFLQKDESEDSMSAGCDDVDDEEFYN